jgi:hypothetical protein
MINRVCLCFLLLQCLTDALMLQSPLQLLKRETSYRELQRAMSSASASMPQDPYEYRSPDDTLLEEVRQELVQNYVDQGEALSKAELEVDYFLEDSARSREYMAMRKYNLSQRDDGLGLDLFMGMQFVGAFIIGFMINAMQD